MSESGSNRERRFGRGEGFVPDARDLAEAVEFRQTVLANRSDLSARARRRMLRSLAYMVVSSCGYVLFAYAVGWHGRASLFANITGWVVGCVTLALLQVALRRRAARWDDDSYLAAEIHLFSVPRSRRRARVIFLVAVVVGVTAFVLSPPVVTFVLGAYGGLLLVQLIFTTWGDRLLGVDYEYSVMMVYAVRHVNASKT